MSVVPSFEEGQTADINKCNATSSKSAVWGGPLLILLLVTLTSCSRPDRIVIGSKNFTEQVILGELVAQAIERQAHLPVDRKLNLGGTLICHQAITSGQLDIYVEYTGTALTAIL